ncbi:MAG: hypothetical protein GC192_11280 [Bacteroidetes bacterium]|nr:hypothetical protein [Bacteroidota bacterium]
MRTLRFVSLLICIAIAACTNNNNQATTNEISVVDTTTTATVEESATTEDEPAAEESGTAPAPVETENIPTPKGFEVIGAAKGDLDKDGTPEKVIVYDTPHQTDFGTERELHIFKQKGSAWELWHKSVGAVLPSQQGGVMGDPFEEVKVENGSLVISHFGGSREKWHYTHRFRLQNNDWQLIGATANSGAPCDYFEDFDYNLSTGKINYSKTTEDCEKSEEHPVTKTEKKDFMVKLKSLPKMDGFHPGENKVALPKTDIEFYY